MKYLAEKLKKLENDLPPLTKRDDFEVFWQETLGQAMSVPLRPSAVRIESPFQNTEIYDISYYGFDQTRIHGWLILPTFTKQTRLPCLIHYHDFPGSREQPWEFMHWVQMGLAVLSVDCREQGGVTGNCAKYTVVGNPSYVNTKGILNHYEYYYRAVYVDSVKALDFAESCEMIDSERLVVRGKGQGGALGMAVCALDNRPKLGLINLPGNSNMEAGIEENYPSYFGINQFLRSYPDQIESVYQTLSYYDVMNLAEKIRCPVLVSVALADRICPASGCFASYHRIPGKKEIAVYPFHEHDDTEKIHLEKELWYLNNSGILQQTQHSESMDYSDQTGKE